jgi:hypothetical protein
MIQVKIKNTKKLLSHLDSIKLAFLKTPYAFSFPVIQKLEQELELWERKTKEALGEQLDEYYIKHKLPRPNPYKLFPYRNTGRQQQSVRARVSTLVKEGKIVTIKSWAEIAVPYAVDTDAGIPPRKDGIIPKWKGWATDIFFGEGRGGIKSVTDIFKEFTNELYYKI